MITIFATDFIFNGTRASDYGWSICNFDGDSTESSGGEIEYTVIKTPSNNTYSYYGAQFNEVLEWKFSIMKSLCVYDYEEVFEVSQYEESEVARWLLTTNTGYGWLQFDQKGFRDIWYKVTWQMSPHQINGKTVGFDLTATSNCGFGFSEERMKTQVINSSTPLNLYVNSDIVTYTLPEISLTATSGNFYLQNTYDKLQPKTEFYVNGSNVAISMDSSNDIIEGVLPEEFNWYFLRLVNGYNTITTDSEVKITVKYREPRRVIV